MDGVRGGRGRRTAQGASLLRRARSLRRARPDGAGAGVPADDDAFDVLPFFWLPGDALREREEEDRVPYRAWKSGGHLHTTPGATIDPAFVAHTVAELAGLYDLRMLGYDRWRIDTFQKALTETGTDVPVAPFGQGYRDMAPAVDILERMIVEHRLRHGGHPVLTWNASNAVATADPAENRKLGHCISLKSDAADVGLA